MKRTIRRSVFETNSSSSHSFTIKTANQEREKCAFRLTSPLAKVVWFCGLCDNAESYYENNLSYYTNGLSSEEIKDLLLERLKQVSARDEELAAQVKKYNCPIEELSESDLDWLLDVFDFGYDEFKEGNCLSDYFQKMSCREDVQEIKRLLIEGFAKKMQISEDEAKKMIIVDANRSLNMERLMEGLDTFEEKVEKLKEIDSYFAIMYEDAEDKVAYVNKRLGIKTCEECTESCRCDHYFTEGALDECYCGFSDYVEICIKMRALCEAVDYKSTLWWVQLAAQTLLSDGVVVEGYEKYCGTMPIYTDKEY